MLVVITVDLMLITFHFAFTNNKIIFASAVILNIELKYYENCCIWAYIFQRYCRYQKYNDITNNKRRAIASMSDVGQYCRNKRRSILQISAIL